MIRWYLLALSAMTTLTTLAAQEPLRIVTLGDSITKGSRPGVGVHQTFASLLQAELRKTDPKIEVINVGIGGERTDQALLRLKTGVVAKKPAIVTIMYGTNDSYVDRGKSDSRITVEQYRDNLRNIVRELRGAGVQPILMTEPRWGDKAAKNGAGEHPNLRLERYVDACREVARETQTPLVDHFAHWTAAAAKGTDVGAWTTDQCHPNVEGHQVLTQTILPVLRHVLAAKK